MNGKYKYIAIRNMSKYLIIILFLIILQNCSKKGTKNRAFYYWKTAYNFQEADKKLAEELGVNKFYIRFFDIDWSAMRQEAIPVGIVNFGYNERFVKEFIPCIFITNAVMMKSSKSQLDTLASRIFRKVNDISESLVNQQKWSKDSVSVVKNGVMIENWHEIQIDCDWSEKSKENYFYFLKSLKKLFNNKQISATVRLWQLKYQTKAGIPPVDKAMLMCYSTGNAREYNIQNSIATFEELKSYINGQKYALPLDFALPIYNWAVLFRNQKFKAIISDFDTQTTINDSSLYHHIKDNRYIFKSDTVMGNIYIRYGDELRLESLKSDDLEKLAKLLSNSDLYTTKSTISFFSWDTTYIQNYGKENIKNYFDRFPGSDSE
jgi:hypothetical protein